MQKNIFNLAIIFHFHNNIYNNVKIVDIPAILIHILAIIADILLSQNHFLKVKKKQKKSKK